MSEQPKARFSKVKSFWRGTITAIGVVVVAAVVIFLVIMFRGNSLSPDEAKIKATDYLNNILLKGKTAATIDKITSLGKDLYKLDVKLSSQTVEAYMTKDGKLFFPEGYDMSGAPAVAANSNQAPAAPAANVAKNDKPTVELFVMSYCPYGTQIEKGIIPAAQALGDKIDFSIKFVDYAMHGQKELTENTLQYCLQKYQSEKFMGYLSCFLKSDDSAACVTSGQVNQADLNDCTKAADNKYKITEQFTKQENWKGSYPPFDINKADNTKYGVQGSPTLVINGTIVSSGRDSASLLKAICGAFTTQPDVCSTAKLSAASPAPGFGEGTDTSGSAAADCATN